MEVEYHKVRLKRMPIYLDMGQRQQLSSPANHCHRDVGICQLSIFNERGTATGLAWRGGDPLWSRTEGWLKNG